MLKPPATQGSTNSLQSGGLGIQTGGILKMSGAGFNAVEIIQRIGVTNTKLITSSTTYSRMSFTTPRVARAPNPRGRTCASVLIVDPLVGDPKLDQREEQDDHEEHPGEGRAKAQVPPVEGRIVQVQHVKHRRVVRASIGHHVRFGEDLEPGDDADDDVEEHHR